MRLFVIAVLLCSIPSPTSGNKQKSHTNAQRESTAPASDQSSPIIVIVHEPTPQPQKEPTQPQAHNRYEWFWPPIWSNWALVIIAGIAAMAAFESLEHLRVQAKATEDAAKAAGDNALAVINAERARIDASFDKRGTTTFVFEVTNFGKSAAHVMSYTVDHASYPKETTEIPASAPARHVGKQSLNNIIFAGKTPIVILEFDIAHYLTESERSGEETGVFTGVVEYIDIFEKLHETTVVYSYQRSTETLVYLTNRTKYT